jgi:hypothetical protein
MDGEVEIGPDLRGKGACVNLWILRLSPFNETYQFSGELVCAALRAAAMWQHS